MRERDTRSSLDQEELANRAIGSMEALQDLITNQDRFAMIKAEPFANLLALVIEAARDAIPNGWPKHGRAVNDLDGT